LPRSCRESVANGARPTPCDTWRPPRPRPRQRDTPPPPQRRAAGGVPGILAPCLSHSGALSRASWRRREQSGSVLGGVAEHRRQAGTESRGLAACRLVIPGARGSPGCQPSALEWCALGPAARLRGARRGRKSCLVHMKSRSALRGAVDAVRGRCGAPELRESRVSRRPESGCRSARTRRACECCPGGSVRNVVQFERCLGGVAQVRAAGRCGVRRVCDRGVPACDTWR